MTKEGETSLAASSIWFELVRAIIAIIAIIANSLVAVLFRITARLFLYRFIVYYILRYIDFNILF